jgi:hypothetical protein
VAHASRAQGLPAFAAAELTAHKKNGIGQLKSPSDLPTKAASPMPAMKLAMSVLACATALLAGCEMADQYATFVPKILRQPSTEPPAPEPEPDVKEMVRAGADTLFTAHPTAVAVSRPHRMAGHGFSACVKAVVVGPMNPDPQPITLLVTIDHGKCTDRHRATEQDGCATESYERVEVARLPNAARTEGGAK